MDAFDFDDYAAMDEISKMSDKEIEKYLIDRGFDLDKLRMDFKRLMLLHVGRHQKN